MSPVDQAIALYDKTPEDERGRFEVDLAWHLKNGYIFSTPEYFLMGHQRGDAWRIHTAVGKGLLKAFFKLMPFRLPFVEWHRKGGEVFHRWETDKLERRIYGNN